MTTLKDLLTDMISEALLKREQAKENNENFGDDEIDEIVEEYIDIISEKIID